MDDAALLDAIAAAPDDDGPRLVLADALIQRGDPWGELIVVGCEIARRERDGGDTRELAKRYGELYDSHLTDPRWYRDYERGFCTSVDAKQGCVAELAGREYMFLRMAEQREAGVERLRAIAEWPLLEQIETLHLEAEDGRRGTSAAEVPHVVERARRLRALQLMRMDVQRPEIDAMLAVPHARELKSLEIIANSELDGTLANVAWPRLEELDLGATRIGSSDVADLFTTDALLALLELDISYNPIDDAAARTLARLAFSRLATLALQGTGIGASGLEALANAPAMQRLTQMSFGGSDTDLDPLLPFFGTAFPALTSLQLATRQPVRQLGALARPLHKLSLNLDDVTPGALAALLASPALQSIREMWLELGNGKLGGEIASVIAAADLPNLRDLSLYRCGLGPDDARRLARASHLPPQLALRIYGDDIGEAAELRARFPRMS